MSLPFHAPLLFPGTVANGPWQSEVKNVCARALVPGMVCRFTYTEGMTGFQVTGEPATGASPRHSRIVAGMVYGNTIEPGEVGRIARCGLVTNLLVAHLVVDGQLLSMSEQYFGAAAVVARTATSLTSWFAVANGLTSSRGQIPAVLFLRRWFAL